MKKVFFALMLSFLILNLSLVSTHAETIDFEGFSEGAIVLAVFGDGGSGPIAVKGTNPKLSAGTNAAMIYDSSCPPGGIPADCSGGDDDLGTPNQTFGGPGVSAGGAAGNNTALNNLLIVSEDLDETDPDDADVKGEALEFDFSALGSVTVSLITIIDVERSQDEDPVIVRLFDVTDSQIGSDFPLGNTGDNGVAEVSLGPTADVVKMNVILNGSGAIDNIVFEPQECSLAVDKKCIVEPPPGDFECSKPISAITMIWDGTEAIKVKAYNDKKVDPGNLVATIYNIFPGDEVTIGGFSKNDVLWVIFKAGTDTKVGESIFHMSCSDKEMNGPEDCGSSQGDGKKNDSKFINDWLLEGLVDQTSSIDCTP